MMSKQLRNFAHECVEQYSKYDGGDGFYSIELYDLPDFVLHEFAALIFADDEALAIEATGPDNKHWDKKMLPALMKYLKNSTDKDEAIHFNTVWRDCVADYVSYRMQELLDDCMGDFNSDHGYSFDSMKTYGIPAHGPI
jgi:hypothetical protein